jgi:transmembrane sensor
LINIENIDELISKFLSGEASPDEAMLLEDWKNDRPENLLYYISSEKMFAFIQGEAPSSEPDSQLAWEKIRMKTVKVVPMKRPRFYSWAAAASIVLLIGLGIFTRLFNGNDQQEIVYNTGKDKKEVKLSDGTIIDISPNSHLVVDKDFGK